MSEPRSESEPVILAEQVAVRCPVCGWQSAAVMVDPEQVNGRWFAFREGASLYRSHFAYEHRPAPVCIVIEGADIGR